MGVNIANFPRFWQYSQFFYAIQMVSKVIFLGLGLVLNRWLIQYLSTEEYATYSVVNDSLVPLAFVFLGFSIPSLVQKYYTNNPIEHHRELLGKVWTTFLVFRLATYLFGVGGLTVLNTVFNFADLGILLLLYTAQFIVVLDWNYRSVCDATGRAWQFMLGDVMAKLIIVSLAYGFVWMNVAVNLFQFGLILIGGYLLSLLLDAWWQRLYTPWNRFDFSIIRDNAKSIGILSASNIITYFYLFSFQVNLTIMNASEQEIGTFSNAYNRLFLTFVSVPAVVMPTIATRLTHALQNRDFDRARRIGWGVAAFSVAYFIAYYFGVMVILNILDPEQSYPMTAELVRVLAWGVLLYPTIHLLGPVFIFFHKEKYELMVSMILAVIGMGIQYVTVPLWGIPGLIIGVVGITALDFFLKGILFGKILRGFSTK